MVLMKHSSHSTADQRIKDSLFDDPYGLTKRMFTRLAVNMGNGLCTLILLCGDQIDGLSANSKQNRMLYPVKWSRKKECSRKTRLDTVCVQIPGSYRSALGIPSGRVGVRRSREDLLINTVARSEPLNESVEAVWPETRLVPPS